MDERKIGPRYSAPGLSGEMTNSSVPRRSVRRDVKGSKARSTRPSSRILRIAVSCARSPSIGHAIFVDATGSDTRRCPPSRPAEPVKRLQPVVPENPSSSKEMRGVSTTPEPLTLITVQVSAAAARGGTQGMNAATRTSRRSCIPRPSGRGRRTDLSLDISTIERRGARRPPGSGLPRHSRRRCSAYGSSRGHTASRPDARQLPRLPRRPR